MEAAGILTTAPETVPKRTTKATAAFVLFARVHRRSTKRDAIKVTLAWTFSAPQ
jgi:hypothetical protein